MFSIKSKTMTDEEYIAECRRLCDVLGAEKMLEIAVEDCMNDRVFRDFIRTAQKYEDDTYKSSRNLRKVASSTFRDYRVYFVRNRNRFYADAYHEVERCDPSFLDTEIKDETGDAFRDAENQLERHRDELEAEGLLFY